MAFWEQNNGKNVSKCCIRNHKRPKVASQRPTATGKSNYIALWNCFETHFDFCLYAEMTCCIFLTEHKKEMIAIKTVSQTVHKTCLWWKNKSHEKDVLKFHTKWGWFWKLLTSHMKYWNMNWDVQERKERWEGILSSQRHEIPEDPYTSLHIINSYISFINYYQYE